jgi:predicted kinase
MTTMQPRLVLLCGLPAAGKTTLARVLADSYGAVRLSADEWKLALGIDPFDDGARTLLEAQLRALTRRLLELGTSVVLEWGFWARAERDERATWLARWVPPSNCITSKCRLRSWCGV